MANTIGIGRRSGITGEDLTDWEWGEFRADVRSAVRDSGGVVIFAGTGEGIWQGEEEEAACVVFIAPDPADEGPRLSLDNLRWRLGRIAAVYGQDSIALTNGATQFITAGTCPVCSLPFDALEWDTRHSGEDGEDVHDTCCVSCNG